MSGRITTDRKLVVGLLCSSAVLLAVEMQRNSIVWDEVAYLASGIRHWTTGNFDLARVNPPLVRLTASLPVLLFTDAKTDWSRETRNERARAEHSVGQDFIRVNGSASFWYYTLARWVCIPLILVGGWVCYRWASELYGKHSGLVALSLWCFSPTLLAHGQLITPDAAATSLGVLANYSFWRWLTASRGAGKPGRTWKQSALAGVTLGIVELTKTTWIILFGLWPCIWLWWRWMEGREAARSATAPRSWQLVVVLALAVYVLNLGYGFEGSGRSLRDYSFSSRALAGNADGQRQSANRFADGILGAIPVPLPRNYVQGIDRTKFEFENGIWSYLHGEWKHGGWWYYYVYALAVKVPLGTWLLLLTAVVMRVCVRERGSRWRDEVVLLVPPAAVLLLVSSQTGFNHHMRYAMPILPYAFIWASQAVGAARPSSRPGPAAGQRSKQGERTAASPLVRPAVATFALTWSVTSSLWIYPHTTTYFNEAAGGPWGGPAHLSDSNIDWGQDLLHLRRWLDKHPEAQPLGFSYVLPLIDPQIAGVDWVAIPPGPDAAPADQWGLPPEQLGPQAGWFAISTTHLHGRLKQYKYFERFSPVATAGYSTYIYHISREEAERVRRELGLPALVDETPAAGEQSVEQQKLQSK